MIRRSLIAAVVVMELFAVAQWAQAANARNLDRATIRSMPITERPYRFGHIYGNNVRRVHKRTHN